jgi:hypothetical protein
MNIARQCMKIPQRMTAPLEENYEIDEIKPEPMLDEVRTSVNIFKKGKSPGYDDVPAELIQAGAEVSVRLYHTLCVEI